MNPLLEWMLNESWRRLSMLSSTCQHVATLQLRAVQRKTAFVEESWWPEFNLSGSMPWCPFPWHKHLPRLALKNCYLYAVYSLNLIHDHEFTSTYIYIPVFNQPALCRLAKESLATEIGKVETRDWTSVFFCGCTSSAPRFALGQPNGYWSYCPSEWKVEKAECQHVPNPICAITC